MRPISVIGCLSSPLWLLFIQKEAGVRGVSEINDVCAGRGGRWCREDGGSEVAEHFTAPPAPAASQPTLLSKSGSVAI